MEGPEPDRPSLAVTKLRAPTLSDLVVERPRITAMFDSAIESSRSLALVSAPAGAGKSTAVATWLARREELTAVWLQIDARDNDPIRFWSGVVIALVDAHPGIDDQVLPAVRAPNVSFIDAALPALVNALDAGDPLAVVLDDYHLIVNQEIHDAVQDLVDRRCRATARTGHAPDLDRHRHRRADLKTTAGGRKSLPTPGRRVDHADARPIAA